MDWRMDPRIPEDVRNLDPRIPGNLRRMFPNGFPPGLGVTNPTPVTNFHPDPAFNYLLQQAQWNASNISQRMGDVLTAFFETLRNMVMRRRAERAAFRRRLDLRARRSTEKRKFSWFRKMR
jgi:hypothetical protein